MDKSLPQTTIDPVIQDNSEIVAESKGFKHWGIVKISIVISLVAISVPIVLRLRENLAKSKIIEDTGKAVKAFVASDCDGAKSEPWYCDNPSFVAEMPIVFEGKTYARGIAREQSSEKYFGWVARKVNQSWNLVAFEDKESESFSCDDIKELPINIYGDYLRYCTDKKTGELIRRNSIGDLSNFAPTITPTKTPIKQTLSLLKPGVKWTRVTQEYGAYSVSIPESWEMSDCDGGGGPTECADIRIVKRRDPTNDFQYFYIVQSYDDASESAVLKNNILNNSNFDIAGLGDEHRAYFDTKDKNLSISFLLRGNLFTATIEGNRIEELGYITSDLEDVFKKVVGSLRPETIVSSCSNPTLVPLAKFPTNFTLSNNHKSDGSDKAVNYWPYTTKPKERSFDGTAKRGGLAAFMVRYKKSGASFTSDDTFSKSVIPIEPVDNSFSESGTDLYHVNCADTEEDGPGFEQPFKISHNPDDLFRVELYGNSSNPQALWSKEEWNIELLKQTRNTVYVKMGSSWQKYTAYGYFLTIPTAYGGKPVIYLYPTKTTKINITIDTSINFHTTIPEYKKSWKIIANPDGSIENTSNDANMCGKYRGNLFGSEYAHNSCIQNRYPYLYWSGWVIESRYPEMKEGWVVEKTKVNDFLEEKLTYIGFSSTEKKDFLEYWVPMIQKEDKQFIRISFLQTKEMNEWVPMVITPKPDKYYRLFMEYSAIDKDSAIQMEPQKLERFERMGFTAIEWGGRPLKFNR